MNYCDEINRKKIFQVALFDAQGGSKKHSIINIYFLTNYEFA